VKRLSQELDMDEKNFNQEISSLIKVKHKNIVRFLGYCADTQGKLEKYGRKMIMADIRQRLLCFEFLPNGALDKHISGTFVPVSFLWKN
jgi:coatomer subunit beta'